MCTFATGTLNLQHVRKSYSELGNNRLPPRAGGGLGGTQLSGGRGVWNVYKLLVTCSPAAGVCVVLAEKTLQFSSSKYHKLLVVCNSAADCFTFFCLKCVPEFCRRWSHPEGGGGGQGLFDTQLV